MPRTDDASHHPTEVGGPYADDLRVGDVVDSAPAVTLTDGLQSQHAAIVGERLHVVRNRPLATAVSGTALVSPALAWDVSIGQSTLLTERVVANLYYRGLRFHHLPAMGDTLRSVATVEAMRPTSERSGRPPAALVAMHIVTSDQEDRTVLDYRRCAMIAARSAAAVDDSNTDVSAPGDDGATPPADPTATWDLRAFRTRVNASHFEDIRVGLRWDVTSADVVSSAPELARLTGNVARVHHDARAGGGRRLVYGGHTISVALHHVCRALPGVVTVVGWEHCDHVGPVHESDLLTSTVEVVARHPGPVGGLVDLHVHTWAADPSGADRRAVLDWRLTAVMA